jgi:RNase H-fold protein (predicted Holliday junction resolvase)
MGKNTRFIGLDVHAETIAVAVAEGRGQVAIEFGTFSRFKKAAQVMSS